MSGTCRAMMLSGTRTRSGAGSAAASGTAARSAEIIRESWRSGFERMKGSPKSRMRTVGLTIFYNCNRCPAYCCSYPRIPVQPSDVVRLAQHFGLSPESAARKFTKKGEEPGEVVMRHQPDKV